VASEAAKRRRRGMNREKRREGGLWVFIKNPPSLLLSL
jgi:hypothetical protein